MDQTESNPRTTGEDLNLYQAIKDNDRNLDLLLNNRRNINDPIITSGPYAGYTALHVACMGEIDDIIEMLIKRYKADANVVAEDGTQPIHLACLFHQSERTRFVYDDVKEVEKMKWLLAGNANIEAEFGQEIFLKYVENEEWCPDFGDKMNILTYAIVYRKPDLAAYLIRNKANVRIISLTNKTLLMYAIERYYHLQLPIALDTIAPSFMGTDLLHHRDNDGVPASHYPFHPKLYGDYRYSMRPVVYESGWMVRWIFAACPDKYALINDDPKTFLINLAAYRSSAKALQFLFPEYDNIAQSKALYYATLPVDEDSDKYLRVEPVPPCFHDGAWYAIPEERRRCIELILKDLVNRLTFGFSVPKEEKELMDKLIATDTDIRDTVHKYKEDFIDGKLKNKFIKFSDKIMTLYDFIMQVCNDRKLKLLARDKALEKSWKIIDFDMPRDWSWFRVVYRRRITEARKRLELMEELEKISQLRNAIPLPYELILYITEYLNNEQLGIFISGFIVNT